MMNHRMQRAAVLFTFVVGLLVIFYPLIRSALWGYSAQEILAKPAESSDVSPMNPNGSRDRVPAVENR